jgi:hypothetical protein
MMLVAAVAFWQTSAFASAAAAVKPLRDRLVVQPGATCLDRDTLVQEVEAWLGNGNVPDDLQIVVLGSALSERDVSLRIRSGSGTVAERHFAPGPERCEHLHAVVALCREQPGSHGSILRI